MPATSATEKPALHGQAVHLLLWNWLKAWWLRLIALALIAGAAAYFGIPYVLGPIVPIDHIARQDIVQTVVASGQVQTPYRVNVGSQVTGTVVDVPVAEGQTVKAGDLLVQLDDADAREAVKLAQAVVAQSSARLKQLVEVAARSATETKMQAQAALANAQVGYDRAQKLNAQGFGTKSNLDDARKALDVAQSQVRAADIQVATSKPGGMDYLTAQTQLEQANAGLKSAEAKLGYLQVRASRDGTLIARNVERGNIVQPGVTLMTLAPAGETQIVVQIDEQNLSLIHTGQKATVSADAYPKQTFQAALVYINPSIDPARGSIQVKLSVPNPPDYLRQDMTVSVEIEVARRTQAIAIATESVHDLASAKPWVLVVENGHARRRDIAVGAIGDATTEVLIGLEPGDSVVHGVSVKLTDGQRIRAQSGA
jgi:HlyD family secretion protein